MIESNPKKRWKKSDFASQNLEQGVIKREQEGNVKESCAEKTLSLLALAALSCSSLPRKEM